MASGLPPGFEVEFDPLKQPFNYDGAVQIGSKWGAVSSTARSPEHNKEVGGVGNSFHLSTRPGGPRAIDIKRRNGVRHADIEGAYKAAGYDLEESLDEGDHSHFAFRSTQPVAKPATNDIPSGWAVEHPDTAPAAPSVAAGRAPSQPQQAPVLSRHIENPETGNIGFSAPLTQKAPTPEAIAFQKAASAAIKAGKVRTGAEMKALAQQHGFDYSPAAIAELDTKFFPALRKGAKSFHVRMPQQFERSTAERIHMAAGDMAAGVGQLVDMIIKGQPVGGAKTLSDTITEPMVHAEVIRRFGKEKGELAWPQVREQLFSKSARDTMRAATGAPEPVTRGEKITSALIEGGTAGLITGGISAPSAGTNAVRTIVADTVAGGTGGVGAEEGYEIAGTPGAIVGGLVGGGLGYGGATRALRPSTGAVEAATATERGANAVEPAHAPNISPKTRLDMAPADPSKLVGGKYGQLEELARDGNERSLLYRSKDGRAAHVHVIIGSDRRAEISIDPFSHEPNRFGPAEIRDAATQLRQLYPEIGSVWGERQTGAKPGRLQEQDLGNLAPPGRGQAMDAEFDSPSLHGPLPRQVDRIDIGSIPRGWTVEHDPRVGRVHPLGEQPTASEMAAAAERVQPGDVTPIPHNAVESLDEFKAIGDPRPPLTAPNPADELAMRTVGNRNRRGPLDLVTWFRSQPRGIKDEGGELAHYGITNAPRKDVDFAGGEGFVGRLVDNRNGMSLDDAAQAAWEAGYFPGHTARPSIPEFLEALADTHKGTNRAFRPEDMDEVARFHSARDEANAIRAAADEGTPLANDLGQPIDPSDLVANQPPASAYEDLARPGGKVANINLANIETKNDIRRALQNVEVKFGGFAAARRGQIGHEQTLNLAADLHMTPTDLLKRRRGQALNAEQAVAARQLLAASHDELIRLAQIAKGGTDEDVLAFRKALLRSAAIQEQVTGATAEAGRALQSFRIPAKAGAARARILRDLVESAGGRESIEDVADKILELQRDPAKLNAFALAASKPRLRDKFSEIYYNILLSGPQTHVVNTVSNALTALAQVPEHAVAATIGAGRRAFRLGAAERVTYSEVGARAVGMMTAVPEGVAEGWRVFKTEQPIDWITKVEQAGHQNVKGLKGKLIRIPTRALSAEDEVFKAIARNSSIRGLAVRKAHSEGLRGDALRERAAQLAANPTEAMVQESFDYARYMTFQDKLGPIGSGLIRASNDMPVLKLVIPFVRTPTNLLKFAVERSPLAPLLKRWREDFKAGGARRDVAISRAVVGSGFGFMITQMAKDGLITGGGPADENAKKLMLADRWQPYSIKIGDKYISYQRLDPFSTTLGIAADMAAKSDHMTEKQREDAATILTASVVQQMESKTWLSGVSDLVQAINDPGRFGESYISRVAASFVPAPAAQLARTLDPTVRDTRHTDGLPDYVGAPLARIKSRIPGLSDNLPAKLDIFGRPIKGEGGLGPDVLSPFWTSTEKHDPIANEMLSLGVTFGVPRAATGGTNEQRAYEALAGRYTYEDLGKAMADPSWSSLGVEEKRDWVDDIKKDARRAAREELGLQKPKKGEGLPPGFMIDAIPPGFAPEGSVKR